MTQEPFEIFVEFPRSGGTKLTAIVNDQWYHRTYFFYDMLDEIKAEFRLWVEQQESKIFYNQP